MIEFHKYEALGNDFVLMDVREAPQIKSAVAVKALCDRHLGLGADGVLWVEPSQLGLARMRLINADGGEAEMCGNGLRCVAAFLAQKMEVAGAEDWHEFEVEVSGQAHHCKLQLRGKHYWVEVAMGQAQLQSAQFSKSLWQRDGVPFELQGQKFNIRAVSMGNPHAVIEGSFASQAQKQALVDALLSSGLFPFGVNVSLVQYLSPKEAQVEVHERGVGWTRACGSGACASVVSGVHQGKLLLDTPIEVRLPGGLLQIRVDQSDRVWMAGPARQVFTGRLAPESF